MTTEVQRFPAHVGHAQAPARATRFPQRHVVGKLCPECFKVGAILQMRIQILDLFGSFLNCIQYSVPVLFTIWLWLTLRHIKSIKKKSSPMKKKFGKPSISIRVMASHGQLFVIPNWGIPHWGWSNDPRSPAGLPHRPSCGPFGGLTASCMATAREELERLWKRSMAAVKRCWISRPGELTFCHGKSPCWMGKSTISMAMFNCYVSHHQRVSVESCWESSLKLRHDVKYGKLGCCSHLRKHMKTQGLGHCSAIRQRRLPPYCFQRVFPLFPPLMECFKARDMVTFDDSRGSRRNCRCSSDAPSPSASLIPTVLQGGAPQVINGL